VTASDVRKILNAANTGLTWEREPDAESETGFGFVAEITGAGSDVNELIRGLKVLGLETSVSRDDDDQRSWMWVR
jgi:hypothetical protein